MDLCRLWWVRHNIWMKISTEIFVKALQLQSPWEVKEVQFKEGISLSTSTLEIEIVFQKILVVDMILRLLRLPHSKYL